MSVTADGPDVRTTPRPAPRRTLRELPAPRGRLAGRVAERVILRGLEEVTTGCLVVAFPDGREHVFGDAASATVERLAIVRDDFFQRLALRGRVGLGEAYVAGDWDSPDLVGLLGLLSRNLEQARSRPPLASVTRALRHRPSLPARAGLRTAERNVHYHYDLGNDLYRLFLDGSMTYSCAYFEHAGQSLEDAQQAKHRRICEKLALGPDDHLLEIGCGWGGFAIHAARERGARVTGITISREQHDLALRLVEEAGVAHLVEILYRDFREVRGSFTKIASIEMLEAIGEALYPAFFAACDRLLAPGGIACVQTIAIPDQRYEAYRRTRDFIQAYIFPGGLLPSVARLSAAMSGSSSLVLHGLEEIGYHYADTLAEWRRRFHERIADVRALGYDARFERMWDYYLAFCEAGFRTRTVRDVQLVLTRPLNDALPRYPSLRPTH